ncbi:MAG: T9SS type A sorting domain-containing protein [Candidatus Cloacimonetes bacterium]|nr:T9SS type A sorting domain-containing protein [Candidatus Cloacimonadota bacterium]
MKCVPLFIMLLLATLVWAQFDVLNTTITPIFLGHLSWADYDNDGDYDLLSGGYWGSDFSTTHETWLYQNNGMIGTTLILTDTEINFLQCTYAASAWGDLDADGDLDIVLMGAQGVGSNAVLIYRNNGNGFQLVFSGLPGMTSGSISLADYDGDGDLDILLTGAIGNVGYTKILRNDGIESFPGIAHLLPQVRFGDAKWVDYDGDGDYDVSITGQTNSAPWRVTKIFRNDDGEFVDSGIEFPALNKSSWEWVDINSDGYLDCIINGFDGVSRRTCLFLGNAAGTFTEILHTLPDLEDTEISWGDFNNDGKPDLLMLGVGAIIAENSYYCKIYLNEGGGVFSLLKDLQPNGSVASSIVDFNNDGRLDYLVSGVYYSMLEMQGGINTVANVNQNPTSPDAISFSTGDGLILRWDSGSDAETADLSLTYRVRMGSTSGACDIMSPGSNMLSGFSRNPQHGKHGQKLIMRALPSGTYHFAVQAIDGMLAASSWSTENSLTLLSPNSPWDSGEPFTVNTLDGSPHISVEELDLSDPILAPYPDEFNSDSAWVYKLKADTGIANLRVNVGNGVWEAYIRSNGAWIACENNFLEVQGGAESLILNNLDFGGKGDVYLLIGRTDITLSVEMGEFFGLETYNGSVMLKWRSYSESSMLGYRIYRSETEDISQAILRTPTLIPATNTTEDAQYSYVDSEVETPASYWYWLQAQYYNQDEFFGPVYVKLELSTENEVPAVSSLGSAYPNPFIAYTAMDVSVKEGSLAEIAIYNLRGQKVRQFTLNTGTHKVLWDGKDNFGAACAAGVYLYRFSSESYNQSRKLLLLGR